MTELCRSSLNSLLTSGGGSAHAGLLLSRGLLSLETGKKADTGGETSDTRLIKRVCMTRPSPLYLAALDRWKKTCDPHTRFVVHEAALNGRLYIGTVRENPLETGLTTSHAYGMPMIPGSAVKGACRARAEAIKLPNDVRNWIFGSEAQGGDDSGESGGLIFHDAWWVGSATDQPFVSEIITVHHQAYYGSEGREPATDFDSPTPVSQIAAQGRFFFAIEGERAWADLAMSILRGALQDQGIGGKTSSGYGFFRV